MSVFYNKSSWVCKESLYFFKYLMTIKEFEDVFL